MKSSPLTQFSQYNYPQGLIMWYESPSDELVCMVQLKEDMSQMWISSIWVSPLYRKKGICLALLDYSTFNGGKYLRVRKNNLPAFTIYLEYGFIVFDETSEYYYMKLKEE